MSASTLNNAAIVLQIPADDKTALSMGCVQNLRWVLRRETKMYKERPTDCVTIGFSNLTLPELRRLQGPP